MAYQHSFPETKNDFDNLSNPENAKMKNN